MEKKLISIITPCYNEEGNVVELYDRISAFMDRHSDYDFEFLFIDNASTDGTAGLVKKLIEQDKRVRLIVNNRNFGPLRSPYWGILQTRGDATIYLASDLQDPPELMDEFLQGWKDGYSVVMAQKPTSSTNPIIHYLRKSFYKL